jgi:thiosulfate dehydrogenase [quinone] large subunit
LARFLFSSTAVAWVWLVNWNFLMAGAASTNPVLFVLAILLILTWKVAGYIGLDHCLPPLPGTPWSPGRAFDTRPEPTAV